MKHWKLFSVMVAIMVASGCTGSGPNDPYEGTRPDPKPSYIVLSGETSLEVGATMQLPSCIVKYDNGSEKPCSAVSASWTSSDPAVVSISGGMVSAIAPGTATLTVSVAGISATVKITVKPKPVVLVGVAVVGDSTQERAGSYQYRCVGRNSDGTERVLDTCSWSYPNSDFVVGKVDSTGLVTLWSRGIPQQVDSIGLVTSWTLLQLRVTVNHQGFSNTLAIRVTGTLASLLSPLSSETAKNLVKKSLSSDGVAGTWAPGITTIWVGPGISPDNVKVTLDAIVGIADGKLQYQFVADSASARVGFVRVAKSKLPNACGSSPLTEVLDYSILKGVAQVREDCPDSVLILAHEFVHVLGVSAHTPAGVDLMSSPGAIWNLSQAVKEALAWMLTTPPGTIPVWDS